jgi:hypothetical protein
MAPKIKKTTKYRKSTLPVRNTKNGTSLNKFEQVVTSNGNLIHHPENSEHYKTPINKSSEDINEFCTDLESQVSVSSRGKDSVCVSGLSAIDMFTELQITEHSHGESNDYISAPESTEKVYFRSSSALESWYDDISTTTKSSLQKCCKLNEIDHKVRHAGCGNRYIAQCEAGDKNQNDDSNRNSESHRTTKIGEKTIEEQRKTDESRMCCSGVTKRCKYHTNGLILEKSNNLQINDSDMCTINGGRPRKHKYIEEQPDKIIIDMELSVNKVSEEAKSVSSNLNSLATSCEHISPTNFGCYACSDDTCHNPVINYHQLTLSNNRGVQRNVDSPPVPCHVADRMKRSSVMTSEVQWNVDSAPVGCHVADEVQRNVDSPPVGCHVADEVQRNVDSPPVRCHVADEVQRNVDSPPVGCHVADEGQWNVDSSPVRCHVADRAKRLSLMTSEGQWNVDSSPVGCHVADEVQWNVDSSLVGCHVADRTKRPSVMTSEVEWNVDSPPVRCHVADRTKRLSVMTSEVEWNVDSSAVPCHVADRTKRPSVMTSEVQWNVDSPPVPCHVADRTKRPSVMTSELQRNVDSSPVRCHVADRTKCSSTVTSDSDYKRTNKPSAEFSEPRHISSLDVPLSTDEVLETLFYCQKLLRVLEHILTKAMSSSTDRNSGVSFRKPSSSLTVNNTRRKHRSKSIPPNVLRHYSYSAHDYNLTETTTETCSETDHSALGPRTGRDNMKEDNINQTSDAKPEPSCDNISVNASCYRDACSSLSLCPEQLRKQRALLKPAAERKIKGNVQMLNMAEILRNAISRRRTVIDPADDLVCGSSGSV